MYLKQTQLKNINRKRADSKDVDRPPPLKVIQEINAFALCFNSTAKAFQKWNTFLCQLFVHTCNSISTLFPEIVAFDALQLHFKWNFVNALTITRLLQRERTFVMQFYNGPCFVYSQSWILWISCRLQFPGSYKRCTVMFGKIVGSFFIQQAFFKFPLTLLRNACTPDAIVGLQFDSMASPATIVVGNTIKCRMLARTYTVR